MPFELTSFAGLLRLKKMARNTIKQSKQASLKSFEEAREAVIKLEILSRQLSPGQLETLEILLDKQAVATISRSVQEAQNGNYESIETIL